MHHRRKSRHPRYQTSRSACRAILPLGLLGRHIDRRSESRPRLRELAAVSQIGQPEVGDLRRINVGMLPRRSNSVCIPFESDHDVGQLLISRWNGLVFRRASCRPCPMPTCEGKSFAAAEFAIRKEADQLGTVPEVHEPLSAASEVVPAVLRRSSGKGKIALSYAGTILPPASR